MDLTRCRLNENAVAGGNANAVIKEILHYAVGNGQAAARVKDDAVRGDAGAVERQPLQYDGVVWSRVDIDGVIPGSA